MIKRNILCGICPGGCAVDIKMSGEKIESLSPAKDSPFSAICLRGRYASEVVYSKDRVLKPMIRTGKKGEGIFKEVSWEEALDYTASRFLEIKEEYGAEAL